MFVPSKFLPNPHDPSQDPALRWARCQYLIEYGQRPSPTLDDDATRDAWRFLFDLRRCREDTNRKGLIQRHPSVSRAYQFFTTAEPLKRAELEARLLADESDETTAPKCGLSPSAVRAFHDLFFDVRSSLHAEYYIVNVVIGTEAHCGLTPGDHATLLKLVGYRMGGLMVDKLLAYFAAPPVLSTPLALLGDTALEELHQKLLLQAMILSMTLPADGVNLDRLASVQQLLARGGSGRRGRAPEEKTTLSPLGAARDFREFLLEPPSSMADDAAERHPDVWGAGYGEEEGMSTRPLVGPVASWYGDWVAVPA